MVVQIVNFLAVLAAIYVVFVFLYYDQLDQIEFQQTVEPYESQETEAEENGSKDDDLKEEHSSLERKCKHPEIDPFDPQMMQFYDAEEINKFSTCSTEVKPITELRNGIIIELERDEYTCWARCNFFTTYTSGYSSIWQPAHGIRLRCDVIETRCTEKGLHFDNSSYYYMHTQIVEHNVFPPVHAIQGKQYSVHIILIDSTSHTQSFRNFPDLKEYLSELNAVDFPYLNKYSKSSRENMIAISFGKIQHRIEREDKEKDLIPEEKWRKTESCQRNLDNEKRLIKEFEEYGYVTNQIDDWWAALNYECAGNEKLQSHHLYLPYVLAYEKDPNLAQTLEYGHCLERHVHALKYTGQFMRSYKEKPKFSFTWLNHVGHNHVWGSIRAEPDLIRLLKENKEEIENSFVFVMGDHGLRHSAAAQTRLGDYERKNPMLTVVVPLDLRNNTEFMDVLRWNSEELQTHFDVRATLLDILKYQPKSNYSDRSVLNIPGELGNSFLRKQPLPRTCESLPILKEYCICDTGLEIDIMRTEPHVVSDFGSTFVSKINRELKMWLIDYKCGLWQLHNVTKMVLRDLTPRRLFDAIAITYNLLSNRTATFKVSLVENGANNLTINYYDRLDSYGSRGDCEASERKNICDCGRLIHVENEDSS